MTAINTINPALWLCVKALLLAVSRLGKTYSGYRILCTENEADATTLLSVTFFEDALEGPIKMLFLPVI
jgi:hypothetical protein